MGDYVILIQMIIFAASTVEKIWNQEKKYRPLYKAHTSCQNLKKEIMGDPCVRHFIFTIESRLAKLMASFSLPLLINLFLS